MPSRPSGRCATASPSIMMRFARGRQRRHGGRELGGPPQPCATTGAPLARAVPVQAALETISRFG
jgi:hypothetical protein